MNPGKRCEYCSRPIIGEPEIKTLRGIEHIYCSDFCFKLHFYDVPTISYDDMRARTINRIYTVSLAANLVMLSLKLGVGLITGSLVMMADGVEVTIKETPQAS